MSCAAATPRSRCGSTVANWSPTLGRTSTSTSPAGPSRSSPASGRWSIGPDGPRHASTPSACLASVTAMRTDAAAARGLAATDPDTGRILAVWYPEPRPGAEPATADLCPQVGEQIVDTVIAGLDQP